jgi:hypothetical protein
MGADYTGGPAAGAKPARARLWWGMEQGSTGQDSQTPRPRCPVPKTARRLGVAAFAFFLIKGLVWLGLAGAAALGVIW